MDDTRPNEGTQEPLTDEALAELRAKIALVKLPVTISPDGGPRLWSTEPWGRSSGDATDQLAEAAVNVLPALLDEIARLRRIEAAMRARPRIVCLCGSTRFYEEFQRANYEETMAGRIVLSVGFYPHTSRQIVTVDGCMGPEERIVLVQHGENVGCTPEQKVALDELHKRKIDLADEVLVLNVGGYIGESTRGEIEHAELTGKPVRYLEQFRAALDGAR